MLLLLALGSSGKKEDAPVLRPNNLWIPYCLRGRVEAVVCFAQASRTIELGDVGTSCDGGINDDVSVLIWCLIWQGLAAAALKFLVVNRHDGPVDRVRSRLVRL